MSRFKIVLSGSLAMVLGLPGAALAQSAGGGLLGGLVGGLLGGGSSSPATVPEIDASTGALAVAALGAALMLVWEINRRRKSA